MASHGSKRVLVSFALISLVFLLAGAAIALAIRERNTFSSGTTMFVSPSSITVTTNQTFEIDIGISEATDIYGWEFKLSWNSSLLEAINVTENSFLGSGGDTYFVSKMNNAEGYMLVGCTLLRNTTGVNGNGTLATVEFRAEKAGSCTLDLYDTKLVDSFKQLTVHSDIDGTVTVSGCVAIRVQYTDGYPRSGADVYEIWPVEAWLGISDEDGRVTICDYLDPGEYYLIAFYGGSQFGPDEVYLYVNATGHGSATITADYPAPLVTVTVLFADGHPVEGAQVIATQTIPEEGTFLGYTNASGQVERCGLLEPGDYAAIAYYPPPDYPWFQETLLRVYENGKGNATIVGTYEITPPIVEILSPENLTYTDTSIPLIYTLYDYSSISWIGYSLDNQANVKITGNTTLTVGLGAHNVIVYANDTFGNMGSSDKVYFTISTRDVAVTNVVPSKTIIGQGYSMSINVTVENQGSFTESFNVTVFYDDTIITLPGGKNHTTTTLTSGNSTTVTLTWNTTGVAYGNYTIKAKATPLPGETDLTDNTLIDGWVVVTIPGDIDGDGDVDRYDFGIFGGAYGSKPGDENWNPNCDIDGDGGVDRYDFGIFGANYGKTT